nr:glutamyl-tRNA reductase [Brooklawnia cerclae]
MFAAGVSHHHVPSDSISALACRADEIVSQLRQPDSGISGVVALATCNRFELYVDADGFHSTVDRIMAAIRQTVPGLDPAATDAFVVYAGQTVVEHLFEVTGGLDSMVVGEVEIIGQVRDALAGSTTVSPPLRRLFQHALTTSKAIASHTDLGSAGRSLASVGLDLACTRLGTWDQVNALVLGTGSYARVVVADLVRRGAGSISVHSRTGQAGRFAESHPVHPVEPAGLAAAVAAADLVVACSGQAGEILTADLVAATRAPEATILPVVDLSGGIDVASDLGRVPQVDLVTLDRIGASMPAEQTNAVADAHDIVTRAVATYLHVEEGRVASPAVTAIRSHVSQIIEQEIENASKQYSPETAEAIARSLRRVSNALLHTPSVRAAELARTGELDDFRHALHTLFGITVEAP